MNQIKLIPLRLLAALPLVAPAAAGATGLGSLAVLYNFTGGADGGQPLGGVIQGPDGTLYGETESGGAGACSEKAQFKGCGTIYSFTQSGGIKILATFTGPNGAFGTNPLTLIGNTLYGTTSGGGQANHGVVFSLNTDGSNFQILHQFNGTDGRNPISALVAAGNGTLYGITEHGGSAQYAEGVLYAITPAGQFSILQQFTRTNGTEPISLVGTSNGIITGTTAYWGKNTSCYQQGFKPPGCGTTFTYNTHTNAFFVAQNDLSEGGYLAPSGAGTTIYGANSYNIFSVSPQQGYTFLASNNPYISDGIAPTSGPVPGPNGTLYGTFSEGFYNILGTAYQVQNGVLSTIWAFGQYGGGYPQSQPIISPQGYVIATCTMGGTHNKGTIWALKPPA